MIILYYLLCIVMGAVAVSLGLFPWTHWEWWAVCACMSGAYFIGFNLGKKHKEENNNENR